MPAHSASRGTVPQAHLNNAHNHHHNSSKKKNYQPKTTCVETLRRHSTVTACSMLARETQELASRPDIHCADNPPQIGAPATIPLTLQSAFRKRSCPRCSGCHHCSPRGTRTASAPQASPESPSVPLWTLAPSIPSSTYVHSSGRNCIAPSVLTPTLCAMYSTRHKRETPCSFTFRRTHPTHPTPITELNYSRSHHAATTALHYPVCNRLRPQTTYPSLRCRHAVKLGSTRPWGVRTTAQGSNNASTPIVAVLEVVGACDTAKARQARRHAGSVCEAPVCRPALCPLQSTKTHAAPFRMAIHHRSHNTLHNRRKHSIPAVHLSMHDATLPSPSHTRGKNHHLNTHSAVTSRGIPTVTRWHMTQHVRSRCPLCVRY